MAATLGNGNITFGDSTTQSTAALPLTGGTLTGALSGTSISTTGNVTIGGALAANGGVTLGDAAADALTINSSVASVPNSLVLAKDAATTNISEQPLVIRRTTTGTPAIGIGAGYALEVETSVGVVKTAAVHNTFMSNVTAGTEKSSYAIGMLHNNALRTTFIHDSSGVLNLYASDDITPDGSFTSHLRVNGVGYAGGIALGNPSMWLGHNSSSRNLILGTASTARITIGGNGNISVNSNNLTEVVRLFAPSGVPAIEVLAANGSASSMKVSSVYASASAYSNSNGEAGAFVADSGYVTRGISREHFWSYSEVAQLSGYYLHMKTNAPINNVPQMYSVFFQGHSYGESKPIFAGLCWYCYNNDIVSVGNWGTSTLSAYKSADGYVVMTMYFSYAYCVAFTASQYTTTQGLSPFGVTSIYWSTAATGVY